MNYYVTEEGAAGDLTTIVLGGELDMCAAPAIRNALRRAIHTPSMRVVVDMANATFLDSTAMGALAEASSRLRESGGGLHLICTNRNVLRTIQIAGLHRHISIDSTLELRV